MKRKQCPKCKQLFICEETANCWCTKYPTTKVNIEYGDCLCKSCLKQPKEDSMQLTNLYVLMPDGSRDYLNEKIVAYHSLKSGMKTASGYPILEEQPEQKGESK